jgi:hypothetical protein
MINENEQVLIGMISEVSAKATLLRSKLRKWPEQALEIRCQTEKLEKEMMTYIKQLFPELS